MIDVIFVVGCIVSIICYFVFGFYGITLFIEENDNEKRDDLLWSFLIVSVVEIGFVGLMMGQFYV